LKNSTTFILGFPSFDLYISGNFLFTERPLNFLKILNQSSGPFPSLLLPLSRFCTSAPLFCRRRRASPPWPPLCHRRHRSSPAPLLPTRHPNLARRCSSSSLSCPTRATVSSNTRRPPPHRRRGELTANPRTSISCAHQHYMSPYVPFLQFLCHFSSTRPKPHCRPSPSTPATLGIAVGSRHQAPLAPIDPRASFLVPYWCSPTPWCSPISVGAILPTSAATAAFGLAMGPPFPVSPNSN
jgi:hypothetical protein